MIELLGNHLIITVCQNIGQEATLLPLYDRMYIYIYARMPYWEYVLGSPPQLQLYVDIAGAHPDAGGPFAKMQPRQQATLNLTTSLGHLVSDRQMQSKGQPQPLLEQM